MPTRRTSFLSFVIFLVALFTYLHAQDKKRKPESLRRASGEVVTLQRPVQADVDLITRLNRSPDLKGLSAAEKVRRLTNEFRKDRSTPRPNRDATKRERLESVATPTSGTLKLKSKQE